MAERATDPNTDAEPSGVERRRHLRIDLPLKARFLREDGEEFACLVTNISAGGAMLKAKTPPAENETIIVYIDELGRFEARVVRSGKHSFAVDYRGRRSKSARTADSLIDILNNNGRRVDRRAEPRIRHDSHATVLFDSGETASCSIMDISLTGASIEIDPCPPLGSSLTLGKMAAKVVRRHEKGVGLVFVGPARKMEDILSAAGSALDGAAIANPDVRKSVSA